MENKDQKTPCSFLMLSSLWSDIFNLITGIGVIFNGILIPGIGYILVHLISILYLMFYKKLGFKYHVRTTRCLMVIPSAFLLAYTLIQYDYPRWSYRTQGLDVICVSVGFTWTAICALLSLATLCKCTRRSQDSSASRKSRQNSK